MKEKKSTHHTILGDPRKGFDNWVFLDFPVFFGRFFPSIFEKRGGGKEDEGRRKEEERWKEGRREEEEEEEEERKEEKKEKRSSFPR